MYAIVESGGKQYKVSPKDELEVEKIDRKAGENLKIEKVLLISNDNIKVGQPYLKNCSVNCTILAHFKQDKKIAFKYKKRKGSKSIKGHRQQMTRLRVNGINEATT